MKLMKQFIKRILIKVVDNLAQSKAFVFPPTFIWKWKLSYLLEYYELETTRFFKKTIKEGMVVIDIGANLGYFTRLFSDLVGPSGKVYAFEPDEDNWEYLTKNTATRANVFLYKQAISNVDDTIDFYHVTGMTGTHTTLPVADSEKRNVLAKKLDSFLATNGIEHVDVVKIDVEGAEEFVFEGMAQTFSQNPSPIVVFEYTPDTSKALFEKLNKAHKLYALSANGARKSIEKLSYRKGKRDYANIVLDDNNNLHTS